MDSKGQPLGLEFPDLFSHSAHELNGHIEGNGLDPRCRFIFIHAPSHDRPIKISRAMLTEVLTYHQVMPAYLDFILPFGRQEHREDVHFSGFRRETLLTKERGRGHKIPKLGCSGRSIPLCSNLKSVDQSSDQAWPWSIRQAAVYHSFDDMKTNKTTWTTFLGNRGSVSKTAGLNYVESTKQLSNVLPIVIGGSVHNAIADRGSAANLTTADMAMTLGIEFEHDSTSPILRLPILKHAIKTVGQAKVACQFPGEPYTLNSYDFIICQNLDTPVIMGRKFIKETEIHTNHKHRLKKAIHSAHHLPYVLSITNENDTQERPACSVNGHSLLARPDTGSVINAMSLTYAFKNNHLIDKTVRKWIRLGDGSVHVTAGTTRGQVSLGDGSSPAEFVEFDIVDELDVDIILGEQLLLDADAFVQYADYLFEIASDYLDFGSIVLLGKAEDVICSLKEKFDALVRVGKTKPIIQIPLSDVEELERKDDMEFHRRKRAEARIKGLSGRIRRRRWRWRCGGRSGF